MRTIRRSSSSSSSDGDDGPDSDLNARLLDADVEVEVGEGGGDSLGVSSVRKYLRMLGTVFPLFRQIVDYDRKKMRGDMVSGLTIGIILIPQGLAYAQLAGLPPIWGLYTGLMPLIPFALLSPTPHLSIGPFAICSLLTSQALQKVVDCKLSPNNDPLPLNCDEDPDYLHACVVLTFFIAVTEIFLSILGIGEGVSRMLSSPVTKAYCSGCAFYIATSQIKNFLEISVRSTNGPLALFGAWYDTASRLHGANVHALMFGISAVLVMLASKYVSPKFPCELVVVIAGILLTWGLHYEDKMHVVGDFSGMPEFEFPDLKKYGGELFGHSLIVTILTYIISISIVKNFAMKHNYAVEGNGHLFALGVANLIGAFFKCYPASGSLSRSVALEEAGGRTNLSSIVTISLLLMTLGFMTTLFKDLPKAVLAAIIFVALKNLFARLRVGFYDLWTLRQRHDFVVWWVTMIGTLITGMQYGVLIGMFASVAVLFVRLHSHSAIGRTFSDLYRSAVEDASSHILFRACFKTNRIDDGDNSRGRCGGVEDDEESKEGISATAHHASSASSSLLSQQQRISLISLRERPSVFVVTYTFGLPLCFLNMDSFRQGVADALDRADAAVKRYDAKRNGRKCDVRTTTTTTTRTVVIIDFLGVDFVDASAMNMLEQIVGDLIARPDVSTPYFAACSDEIHQQMGLSKLRDAIGGDEYFASTYTGALSRVRKKHTLGGGCEGAPW
eukprot:g70.t1